MKLKNYSNSLCVFLLLFVGGISTAQRQPSTWQTQSTLKNKALALVNRFLNPADKAADWKSIVPELVNLVPRGDVRFWGVKQRLGNIATTRNPQRVLNVLTALNNRLKLGLDKKLAQLEKNQDMLATLIAKQSGKTPTPPKQRYPFDLTVVGFINFADGIGRQAIGLIDALKNTGLRINWVPSGPASKFTDIPPLVLAILEKYSNNEAGAVAILEDILTQGVRSAYQAVPQGSLIKIAYSMLESTAIPQEWVSILNTRFDAVAVPDPFLVDVYKNSGVKIPIFMLPLGAYLEDFLKLPLKTKANTPFVFGSAASGSPRKNTLLLVKAFAQAFDNNPNIRLKLNMRSSDKDFLETLLDYIHAHKLTNIDINVEPLSHEKYLQFMHNLDAYVNLSKGEGFSVQPRESLAAGIPTIITDNTAQSTIAKSGFVRAVPSPIKEPASYNGLYGPEPLGYFFDTTPDLAALALKDVYYNYPAYLKKARQGREWVKQYLYSNLKNKYLNLVKPKKVILGKENKVTDEALETNSPKLYKKYLSIISS